MGRSAAVLRISPSSWPASQTGHSPAIIIACRGPCAGDVFAEYQALQSSARLRDIGVFITDVSGAVSTIATLCSRRGTTTCTPRPVMSLPCHITEPIKHVAVEISGSIVDDHHRAPCHAQVKIHRMIGPEDSPMPGHLATKSWPGRSYCHAVVLASPISMACALRFTTLRLHVFIMGK